MLSPDPTTLAARQFERDQKVTSRFRGLFERKVTRMSVSPLAYLRGSAPLFYELLAAYPELRRGPLGEGWLSGDAHLENFGVYRTAAKRSLSRPNESDPVVFNINDFDEAIVGPWRFDVLRLVTSLILGGRELGADGVRSISMSRLLLDAYVGAAFQARPLPAAPWPVAELLRKVDRRSHIDLLNSRTRVGKLGRRFVQSERYVQLPKALQRAAVSAFGNYVRRLDLAARFPKEDFGVVDVAFRVAGTGSLGGLRVAVLTRGRPGAGGGWIFDMKEQGLPSATILLGRPAMTPANRVFSALDACVPQPPRMAGTTKLNRLSMFVRRLAPQEDRLNLSNLPPAHLGPLAAYLGSLLGAAHRRGATKVPPQPWSKEERSSLIDRAVTIAGIHEAAYLAMCKLARER